MKATNPNVKKYFYKENLKLFAAFKVKYHTILDDR